MDQARSSPIVFFCDRPTFGARNWALLCVVLVMIHVSVFHADDLMRNGNVVTLVAGWTLLAVFVICGPRWLRNRIEAYRGTPYVRIDERGIWLRAWQSLDWIDWADVWRMELQTGSNYRCITLTFRNERKYLDRATWIDWVPLMAANALARAFDWVGGPRSRSRAIPVADSLWLKLQWDQFISALDPILMRHGIPKLEAGGLGKGRPSSLWRVDERPSALVAQFPQGGPSLRRMIARLVEVEPAMAGDFVSAARAANPAQQESIGAGLADASGFFTDKATLDWSRDAEAHIQAAMNAAGDGTRAGWARARAQTTPLPPAE